MFHSLCSSIRFELSLCVCHIYRPTTADIGSEDTNPLRTMTGQHIIDRSRWGEEIYIAPTAWAAPVIAERCTKEGRAIERYLDATRSDISGLRCLGNSGRGLCALLEKDQITRENKRRHLTWKTQNNDLSARPHEWWGGKNIDLIDRSLIERILKNGCALK